VNYQQYLPWIIKYLCSTSFRRDYSN